MPEPLTCHLPKMTALFCIGVERLGQTEALQRHSANIVVPGITRLGDRR